MSEGSVSRRAENDWLVPTCIMRPLLLSGSVTSGTQPVVAATVVVSTDQSCSSAGGRGCSAVTKRLMEAGR